jgi:hypothetical protein
LWCKKRLLRTKSIIQFKEDVPEWGSQSQAPVKNTTASIAVTIFIKNEGVQGGSNPPL